MVKPEFAIIRFAGRLPKRAARPDECEDAFVIGEAVASDSPLRVGVADGASQSLFARVWAEAIATAFVAHEMDAAPDMPELNAAVARVAADWRKFAEAQQLPWFAEPKRENGSFTTLIGVEVRNDGKWTAIAVGDSCVFQVRERRMIAAFPVRASDAFPNLPILIGTKKGQLPTHGANRHTGNWQAGDDLFIMTDALSKWFLQEVERGMEPWRWLDDIGERQKPLEDLAARLDVMREVGRIADDDTTLIHIHFPLPESEAAESVAESEREP